MDSGSPRTRIDQFFASQKKRTFSPKTAKDSSPGAKGSLESYLVTSQNDCSSNGQGSVKRNLDLEIELSTKHDNGETLLPTEGGFRGLDSSGAVSSGICGASGGVGAEADGKGSSELPTSGLLPTSLPETKSNVHKREGSPSIMECKSSKKRHCIPAREISQPNAETSDCAKRNPNLMPCVTIAQKTETIVKPSREVDHDNNISEQQMSLTPATACKNSSARETPISSRGGSIFSPREAFWNKAIQVVDGLFAQPGKDFMQVVEDMNIGKIQHEGSSHIFCKGSSKDKLNGSVIDGNSCYGQTDVNISLPVKHVKNLDKEASPLPVKHFDFSCEEKNLDESMLAKAKPNPNREQPQGKIVLPSPSPKPAHPIPPTRVARLPREASRQGHESHLVLWGRDQDHHIAPRRGDEAEREL